MAMRMRSECTTVYNELFQRVLPFTRISWIYGILDPSGMCDSIKKHVLNMQACYIIIIIVIIIKICSAHISTLLGAQGMLFYIYVHCLEWVFNIHTLHWCAYEHILH